MHVKVFLCGYHYPGRKINLASHDSYDSLYCGLHRLFRHFDKAYDPNDSSEEERYNSDITFYYLDCEGNTALVGDIPWE
ncbi:Auxin-responsive protein IAA27 [Carex littledalei]|uniref:Auxin-responsive protein n=1 Tax=Carex littledalei TaxID=544730 RepID=A0A833VGF7_9POAL|nr:Auxin-responsive protein IAA27 [Carex littledalei]